MLLAVVLLDAAWRLISRERGVCSLLSAPRPEQAEPAAEITEFLPPAMLSAWLLRSCLRAHDD
jgi:hypothetical protein